MKTERENVYESLMEFIELVKGTKLEDLTLRYVNEIRDELRFTETHDPHDVRSWTHVMEIAKHGIPGILDDNPELVDHSMYGENGDIFWCMNVIAEEAKYAIFLGSL